MKANANPTKDFFVRMITKDISLEDCLLDLIDNCLDGARRTIVAENGNGRVIDNYDRFFAALQIGPDEFKIEDNCGGISIENASEYAFRFGRSSSQETGKGFPIGLYGIGMKRAILKIGKHIEVRSSTDEEAFVCTIPVEEWLQDEVWEFEMDNQIQIEESGTAILIRDLYEGIAEAFSDRTFINGLTRIIARDYARFIEKGFNISINGIVVAGHKYNVRSSDVFRPYRKKYKDEGVHVEILAGMAAPPPDNNEPTGRLESGYFGWFIFCNDRVVLAEDKTERTVWGNEGFVRWHPQYNGFLGMVLFHGDNPNLLPWTTTKRDVDDSQPLYRRAIIEMKKATQPWIEYTNQRKSNPTVAKKIEQEAQSVSFFEVEENSTFRVPEATKNTHH